MSRRKEYEFSENTNTPNVWRSLESKNDSARAYELAKQEFPFSLNNTDVSASPSQQKAQAEMDAVDAREAQKAADYDSGFSRRNFMLFAGATASLFGCARRPVENIVPYARQPEQAVPGLSYYYATARVHRGETIGLLVESHEGRPTKIEGNPEHPANLGATDALSQATVWDLYDPDRSREPRNRANTASMPDGVASPALTLKEADAQLSEVIEQAKANGGKGLRILMGPTTSPTVMRLRAAIKARFGEAKFHTYASITEGNARQGAKLAFEQVVNTLVDYEKCAVVLTLDADVLGTEPGAIRAARGFANSRKLRAVTDNMSRLYVVEPTVTTTGLASDHRLPLAAQDVESYLIALAGELASKHGLDLGPLGSLKGGKLPEGVKASWTVAVAKDLASKKGKGAIVVGSGQPARVHALAHALNWALGNAGQTVSHFSVADKDEAHDAAADLKALAKDMEAGKVDALVILGGNPVYDAPSDVKFGAALAKVKRTIHLSSHYDETSRACGLHIPRAHDLETWSDQRSLSGVLSISQPLIAPLHASRSDLEVLGKLANETSPKALNMVQETLRAGGMVLGLFEKGWAAALKRGVLNDVPVKAFGGLAPKNAEIAAEFGKAPKRTDGLEVTFSPCGRLFDGRHANNPWLQELPEVATKLTWDNAAFIAPATAKALSLETGDMVQLARDGAAPIEVAVFVLPGQAPNSIGLQLGWGRQDCGRYGSKHGFDVSGLRTSDAMAFAGGVKLTKMTDVSAIRGRYADLGKASEPGPALGRTGPVGPFDPQNPTRYKLVQTQEHGSMEGRALAIDASLEEYRANPKFPQFPKVDKSPTADRHNTRSRAGSPDPKVLPLWEKRHYERDTPKGKEQNPTGFKWGMSIDLNACTGCNACVVACQSENNIPAVGKEQVMRGREISWIRIDRYFLGEDENNPEFAIQPVACVQCEEAPCENVCPVNATEHSPEGLNDMSYNRCIGTRYCANNCPYKVRRFNYLNFHGADGDLPDTERMHMNPNVTIRMRGVMEKCTYCVQRIQEGKISAKREGRVLKDGDIVSACQQACPSEAIVFGDLNDPNSKVAKTRDLDRAYRLLAEIGTGPRTTYLGKIRNLNKEMV
jgi:Fe-S-cluster-containing dehydrogenase component/anaerobic selenocysteine-containing dehydrogenase